MSLFEVEGWKLPKQIVGGPSVKKSTKAKSAASESIKKKDKQQVENRKIAPNDLQDLYEGKKRKEFEQSREKSDYNKSGDRRSGVKRRSSHDDYNKQEHEPAAKLNKEASLQSNKKQKNSSVKHNDSNDSNSFSDVIKVTSPVSSNISIKQSASAAQKLTPLQLKMKEKLTGARFRWINEQLYTTSSAKALELIQKSPEMFDEYHEGFRSQVKSWPENPVDTLVGKFKERLEKPINAPGGLPGNPSDGRVVVADMGCGEAQLAHDLMNMKGSKKSKKLKFQVHSFDLKKVNERITVADIKNVPLPDQSADIVVFCLALMGTNFLDFIREGLRILKPRGELWIAEIKSRFVDSDSTQFVETLKGLGLFHKATDDSNKMFIRFEFFKPPKDILDQRQKKQEARKPKFIDRRETDDEKKGPEGTWLLKPCIYKRR